MPDRFHQVQYIVAAILCGLLAVLYCFCPEARSDGILTLAGMAGGFLFGKFSNGFKRPGPNGRGEGDG